MPSPSRPKRFSPHVHTLPSLRVATACVRPADSTTTVSPAPATRDDVPIWVLVPAFVISELKTAFIMGFVIFIPFLIIDMVVSSVLMSMGMMMLPPVVISLPFKLIFFVLVDGWRLVAGSLVESFRQAAGSG